MKNSPPSFSWQRALSYSEQRSKEAIPDVFVDMHAHAKPWLTMSLYSLVKKVESPVSAIVTCELFISPASFPHLAYSVMEKQNKTKHVLNGFARSFIYFNVFIFFLRYSTCYCFVIKLPEILSRGVRQKLLWDRMHLSFGFWTAVCVSI